MQMIGRYALYRPLADGGTATVHLGCHRAEGGFSRPVAIKKPHPHLAKDAAFVSRLLAEARIASRIRHPNVVAVLDVVPDPVEPLLVFEYVHGESLSQLIGLASKAGEPVPLPIALRLVIDALEGLHAAHEATNERGVPLMVVHRDVSPHNVMVDTDGRARIVDFGVAKALERPFTTESGVFWGKLAYAAPEQVAGSAVDRRTDIWAAGLVLWELVAGRRYFVEAVAAEIVHRITTETITPPSSVRECPPAVDEVVRTALERDPDLRFATAREMALALEKAGPIADARDVARWVRKLARSRLDARSLLVEEMEVELRRLPPADLTAAPGTAMTSSIPTQPELTVAPPPRRGRAVVGVLAFVALAGVIGTTAFLGRTPRPPTAASASATLAAEPAPPEAPATAASIETPPPTTAPSPAPARTTAPTRASSRSTPASTPAKKPARPGDPLKMDQRL